MITKKLITLMAACLCYAGLAISGSAAADDLASKPNIVFVITDDQGYGDLSCHGNPILKTPAIDALYEESVRLTNYHVSPTCAPTRGALLSGHYTNRAGPWHTIMGRSFLRTTSTTFGEVFSDNGYATGLFGKWHLGDNYPYRPTDRGFQEVVTHGGGGVGQTPDYWDNAYFDDTYFHNDVPTKYKGYCTDVYFKEAKRFIKDSVKAKKPFLAYISPNAPHGPYLCPEEFSKPYMDKGISEREAIFFGMIANIDHNVALMRDWLQEQGLDQNTIFIFTTDNGTATGGKIYNAGMNGKKGSQFEGGHRVPFFIHWPEGKLTTAYDIDELSAHIDILPTIIDLCGLNGPRDYAFDGRSLAPLIYKTPTAWPNRVIITDSQRVRDPIKWKSSSTMTNRWRLIDGKKLFDMQNDASQKKDVAKDFPEVVESLRSEYDAWWDSISPSFKIDTKIIIGHDEQNPTQLTCHDWLTHDGSTPWNQSYVRDALQGNGDWAVTVAETGKYEIKLRRWPEELSRPINADLEKGSEVPGIESYRETPGRAITVQSARLSIGDIREELPIEKNAEEVTFNIELEKGDYMLRGEFLSGAPDNSALGSYYAVITRL